MNYTVTCVCGQQFVATDGHIGRHVTCPACSRALIPVLAEPADAAPSPAATATGAGEMQAMKRCPFCGESILEIAKKCRYCGEFMDRSAAPQPAGLSAGGAVLSTQPAKDVPVVFELSVSQWDNFWKYVICVTALAAVIGATVFVPDYLLKPELKENAFIISLSAAMVIGMTMYFFYATTRAAKCRIYPTRIETETGLFSKRTDSLDLFRVLHIDLKQGLLQRMLGFGSVVLTTADKDTPTVELYQIPKARKVYKYLQNQVPIAAKERGVTYIER